MKKGLVAVLAALSIQLTLLPVASAGDGRGGFMGLVAGCCFGIRAAAAYNDGKDIHWREWGQVVPFLSLVFGIWNGIDGANGVTTAELAARYGASYY